MVAAILVVFTLNLRVEAGAVQVQKITSVTNGGTSVSTTFGATASADNLIIVICGARDSVTLTGPAGFSQAINENGTPSQAIFYKVAAGGEQNLSCGSSGTTTRLGMQSYEYRGLVNSSPLDAVNTTASTGTNSSPASGSVTTTNANDLLIAGVVTNANTAFSAWSNSFAEQEDFANGGAAGSRSTYGGADRTVTATGTYSTTATAGASGAWRGQIAAFKLINPVLSIDIVDSGGSSVASPSITMSSTSFNFSCHTVTGTFGVSSEKIRASNYTGNALWTLAIAATSGPTSTWTSGSLHYDFNDSGGSGCSDGGDSDSLAGQLTINPSGATLTPKAGCSSTGVTKGSSSAFIEGTTNSITLLSTGSTANLSCLWDLTSIAVSQAIPAEQLAGSYSINLTLTITAN